MRWLLLLLFGGIGIAALVRGIVSAARQYTRLRVGVQTVGTVVEFSEVRSTRKGSRVSYYPVAQFAADGTPYRVTGSTGSSVPGYKIDAKVRILHDRADPSRAQIVDLRQFWLGPLFGVCFGLVFFAAGIEGFLLLSECDTCVIERVEKPAIPSRWE